MTGQQSLGPAAIAAFQVNESIAIGQTFSYTYTTQITYTGAAHTFTQFYGAMAYEDRYGTCDIYGSSGYQGKTAWTGRWTAGLTSPGSLEWPK